MPTQGEGLLNSCLIRITPKEITNNKPSQFNCKYSVLFFHFHISILGTLSLLGRRQRGVGGLSVVDDATLTKCTVWRNVGQWQFSSTTQFSIAVITASLDNDDVHKCPSHSAMMRSFIMHYRNCLQNSWRAVNLTTFHRQQSSDMRRASIFQSAALVAAILLMVI